MDTLTPITIDDSLWPLLWVNFAGSPSLVQQGEHFAQLLDYLRRGDKCVFVLDTRQAGMMRAEHRQKMAEFLTKYDVLLRARLLGCAAIITSPEIRLAASIVFYLNPPSFPYLVVNSPLEAVKWAAECLDGGGLARPAEHIRHYYGLHEKKHLGSHPTV